MSAPLDPATVRGIVDGAFPGSAGTAVYADRVPRGPGLVAIGGAEHRLTDAAILAFRDDMPGANWMHPCTYALVDIATGALLTTAASDRPPVFGDLPDTWLVVSAPDGIADLIPPPSPSEQSPSSEPS
jgi:hypothetical protein